MPHISPFPLLLVRGCAARRAAARARNWPHVRLLHLRSTGNRQRIRRDIPQITLPAAVMAPSPTVTGATSAVSEPMKARSPITVRCLVMPS